MKWEIYNTETTANQVEIHQGRRKHGKHGYINKTKTYPGHNGKNVQINATTSKKSGKTPVLVANQCVVATLHCYLNVLTGSEHVTRTNRQGTFIDIE